MMKRFGTLAIGLMLMVLTGCQQATEPEPVESRMVSLNIGASFHLKMEIGEWGSGVESDQTMNGEEVKSRADGSPATRMAFVLIDEDGQKVVSQEKTSDDSDYLTLRARVPVGTYGLVAFAHNGSTNATVGADATVSTPGEKLTDSFVYYGELSLDEESNKESSVTLKRCVSRLSVKHTDKIPTGAASVEIEASGAGNVLNATTGLAAESCEQKVVIQIPQKYVGTSDNTFSLYTFLPEKETEVDLVVSVKDSEGNVLTRHELKDVPVKVNVKTICTGVLFHADQDISVSIESEWGEDEEVEF